MDRTGRHPAGAPPSNAAMPGLQLGTFSVDPLTNAPQPWPKAYSFLITVAVPQRRSLRFFTDKMTLGPSLVSWALSSSCDLLKRAPIPERPEAAATSPESRRCWAPCAGPWRKAAPGARLGYAVGGRLPLNCLLAPVEKLCPRCPSTEKVIFYRMHRVSEAGKGRLRSQSLSSLGIRP